MTAHLHVTAPLRDSFDEFAWFVGIFEGEGCIDIAHRDAAPRLRLQVQMTDGDIISRCHAFAKCGFVCGPYRRKNGRKDSWIWCAQGDGAYAILTRMLPHLGDRRRARAIEILVETGYSPSPNQLCLEVAR